ncbi:MAG: PQQ-binding-like beta-propeller repeat protein [candidate division KSB1 bacterium]|nr:PQQ-binding-like beta-propeller repeat protein [candidate division KSB1 bacterium]
MAARVRAEDIAGLSWPNEPLHSTHTDCQPLVGSDGAIYIGTNNGNFYALEPDGQLRWQFKADAQISTPQLNIDLAGNIYFFDENSTFYALASDGSLRFKAQAPDEMQFAGTGLAFSPDGNTFYTVAYKRDSTVAVWLMAYSLNGEEIWRYQLGKGDFLLFLWWIMPVAFIWPSMAQRSGRKMIWEAYMLFRPMAKLYGSNRSREKELQVSLLWTTMANST